MDNMKIKKNINVSVDITTDEGVKICTLSEEVITFPDKADVLSIKAAYYAVNYKFPINVYQQFTITAKSNDYYYDCTINPISGNKQLLVRDSYNNVILTINGIVLRNAIDYLFKLENIKVDDNAQDL